MLNVSEANVFVHQDRVITLAIAARRTLFRHAIQIRGQAARSFVFPQSLESHTRHISTVIEFLSPVKDYTCFLRSSPPLLSPLSPLLSPLIHLRLSSNASSFTFYPDTHSLNLLTPADCFSILLSIFSLFLFYYVHSSFANFTV